uniref:Secreted protein n=1 Tax=Steinernema glaseri TaxID=37863 RepID=A0A1I8A251_9BILA
MPKTCCARGQTRFSTALIHSFCLVGASLIERWFVSSLCRRSVFSYSPVVMLNFSISAILAINWAEPWASSDSGIWQGTTDSKDKFLALLEG